MLTTIEEVVKSYPSVKALYNFKKVPMDDFKVWLLYHRGDVKGIFQVESELCKQWCKKIKPSNIDELSALISLIRPGGLESGFAEKYANIKCGDETLSYIHNALIPALSPTYSCLVFQEQILRICIDIAGFDEVQADNARRAVGKKLPEEMVKVKKEFLECAKKRGIVSEEIAEEIFSWIQKSVRYLFNAAHSYSYGYISYFTAWQKCYYPTEFYTAALTYSSEKVDPKEEIYELVQDARLHNINVYPPSLHSRNTDFEIMDDKKILFGLSHIRGVGRSAVEVISGLKLDTFKDFVSNLKKIHRNVAESLIKSGACDCYGHSRTKMLRMVHIVLGRTDGSGENIPAEVRKLTPNEFNQFIKEIDQGFEEALKSIITTGKCIPKRVPTIEAKINYINQAVGDTNTVKALWEDIYLGLSLTCSAVDDYKTNSDNKTCKQIIQNVPKGNISLNAVVDEIKHHEIKKQGKNFGKKCIFMSVSDRTGCIDNICIWPDKYEDYADILFENSIINIKGYKNNWQGKDSISVKKIEILN